jgi:hypothetical protein
MSDDEIVVEGNREKNIALLKEKDSGYDKVTDTSIAEPLGDFDLNPVSNATANGCSNYSMIYIGAGGLVLLCCCWCKKIVCGIYFNK